MPEKLRSISGRRMPGYPPRIPSAGEIPSGSVLVHNCVQPAQRQGTRGFRFYYLTTEECADAVREGRIACCDCGWAPHLAEHYGARRGGVKRRVS